ncbi:unnamed protein product [Boreogadus saida]
MGSGSRSAGSYRFKPLHTVHLRSVSMPSIDWPRTVPLVRRWTEPNHNRPTGLLELEPVCSGLLRTEAPRGRRSIGRRNPRVM